VPNVSFSSLLPKNTKFNLYSTAITPVLLYGCGTWCFRFRYEHGLRVFENRVLRKIFGPKNDEVKGNGEDYFTSSFVICTSSHLLFG
jgi:hypothetical protein